MYLLNRSIRSVLTDEFDPAYFAGQGLTNGQSISIPWKSQVPNSANSIPAASTNFTYQTNAYGDRSCVRTDPMAGALGPAILSSGLVAPLSLIVVYRFRTGGTGDTILLESRSGGTPYVDLKDNSTVSGNTNAVWNFSTGTTQVNAGAHADLALITLTIDGSGNVITYNGSEVYNTGSGVTTSSLAGLTINGATGGINSDIFYIGICQGTVLTGAQVRSMAQDLAISFEHRVFVMDGNSITIGNNNDSSDPPNLLLSALSTAGISNWPIRYNAFGGRTICKATPPAQPLGIDDNLVQLNNGTDSELVMAYDHDYFCTDACHIFMGSVTNDGVSPDSASIANVATAITAIHIAPIPTRCVWLPELNRYTLSPPGAYDSTVNPSEAHRNSLVAALTGASAPDVIAATNVARFLANAACQNATWFDVDNIHPTDAGNVDLMTNSSYGLIPLAASSSGNFGHSKKSMAIRVMVTGQGNTNGTALNFGIAWPTNNTGWSISGGSGASISASVAVGGASATLTVNPGSVAGNLVVTDPNGTTTAILVMAALGSYTLSGPASGNVNSASSNFTITFSGSGADGSTTVTLSDGSAGGSFNTGTTFTPPAGTTVQHFTYTGVHGGTVAITATNSGSAPAQTVIYNVIAPVGGDYDTAALATNPTMHMPLSEAVSSTQVLDATSNHINSTSVGAGVTLGATGLVKDGKTAASFNGASNAAIGLGPVSQFQSAAAKFAVAGWIKCTNVSGSRTACVLANAYEMGLGIDPAFASPGVFQAAFYNSGFQNVGVTSVVSGTTYFLYAQWDGTKLTLAINGVQDSQITPAGGPVGNGNDWNIGSVFSADTGALTGTIQKVTFWSGSNVPGVSGALNLYNVGTIGPTFAITETRVTPGQSTTIHITASGFNPAAYTDFSVTHFTVTSGTVSGNTATLTGTPAAGPTTVKVTHTPTGAVATVADAMASPSAGGSGVGLNLGIDISL